jgi:hypothetical protein
VNSLAYLIAFLVCTYSLIIVWFKRFRVKGYIQGMGMTLVSRFRKVYAKFWQEYFVAFTAIVWYAVRMSALWFLYVLFYSYRDIFASVSQVVSSCEVSRTKYCAFPFYSMSDACLDHLCASYWFSHHNSSDWTALSMKHLALPRPPIVCRFMIFLSPSFSNTPDLWLPFVTKNNVSHSYMLHAKLRICCLSRESVGMFWVLLRVANN